MFPYNPMVLAVFSPNPIISGNAWLGIFRGTISRYLYLENITNDLQGFINEYINQFGAMKFFLTGER
jgi:hypothetical protein